MLEFLEDHFLREVGLDEGGVAEETVFELVRSVVLQPESAEVQDGRRMGMRDGGRGRKEEEEGMLTWVYLTMPCFSQSAANLGP